MGAHWYARTRSKINNRATRHRESIHLAAQVTEKKIKELELKRIQLYENRNQCRENQERKRRREEIEEEERKKQQEEERKLKELYAEERERRVLKEWTRIWRAVGAEPPNFPA